MTDQKRSKITDEHREEARKLKALWDARALRTQAQFGEAFSLGNQSNVGHYLNARSPLNLSAALAFSKELGVEISEFSPRLMLERNQLMHSYGTPSAPTALLLREEVAVYEAVSLEQALQRISAHLTSIGKYNPNTVKALFETLANDPSLHGVVAAGLRTIKAETGNKAKQIPPAKESVTSRAA